MLHLIRSLPAAPGAINTVAISPDGSRIASGGSKHNQTYRQSHAILLVNNGVAQRYSQADYIWSLQVYNRSWGKIDLAYDNKWAVHGEDINSIAFGLDGAKLIVGSAASHDKASISQWNIDEKYPEFAIGHNESIYAVTSTSSGGYSFIANSSGTMRKILNSSNDVIQEWSISKEKGWNTNIYTLVVNASSKYIYSGGEERKIRAWYTQTGEEVAIDFQAHQHAVRSLAVSNDDHYLVSGSNQRIKIWNAQTGELLQSFYGHSDWVRGLVVTTDSQFIISAGDEKIKIWELKTGKKLHTIIAHDTPIRSIALSRDGTTLVSGATDGIVKVWQVEIN
jgi:COMPASS component SWD3